MGSRITILTAVCLLAGACDVAEETNRPPLTDAQQALLDEALDDAPADQARYDEDTVQEAAAWLEDSQDLTIQDQGAVAALLDFSDGIGQADSDAPAGEALDVGDSGPSAATLGCQLAESQIHLASLFATVTKIKAQQSFQAGASFSIDCWIDAIQMQNYVSNVARQSVVNAGNSWSARAQAIHDLDIAYNWAYSTVGSCGFADWVNHTALTEAAESHALTTRIAIEQSRSFMNSCYPW